MKVSIQVNQAHTKSVHAVESKPSVIVLGFSVCLYCQPHPQCTVSSYAPSHPVQQASVHSHYISPAIPVHGCTSRRPDFVLMFSLLLLLIWTLGAKSSAPMWVSASISTYGQMKVLWWYARYSSVWLWNQAIRHPLLPREKSGDLSLALGTLLKLSLLQTLKYIP